MDLQYDRKQLKFLPPNTTALIQPINQCNVRAFKALRLLHDGGPHAGS